MEIIPYMKLFYAKNRFVYFTQKKYNIYISSYSSVGRAIDCSCLHKSIGHVFESHWEDYIFKIYLF